MRRLLLIALLCAAPVSRAAPEASPELAALVPAETLMLLEGNDLDGKGRYGEGTAIGKLLAEPDVRRFAAKLAETLRMASGNARRPLAMFGLAPEDFDGIALRRMGVALVDASIEAQQVDVVLYLETRGGGDKVARILQGLRQAAEAFLGAQFREEDVRGRKVVSTAVGAHEICYAAQGDRFVVTTRRARMDEVLKAMDEGHPAPLAAAPRMTRLKERMGAARNAMFVYMDAPAFGRRVLDTMHGEFPGKAEEARRVVNALGLDAVEAVAFADIPEGAGYRTEGAILLKERRGLFALASATPPSHRFAKMTPADALAYGGESCDLAALWDGILGVAGGIDAKARQTLERGAREGGAVVGLDLRKDLLEALGTEWGGYVAWPPGGGALPDVVLFATVRDRERLVKTLDALAGKAREFRGRGATVTSATTEFRGREIRFLEITDKRGEPRPYAPAWAFGDDYVVFGLCPQTVKHALMEKRSLADRADFQELLGAAPRTSVSATYFDLGRAAMWLYAAAVPFLQVAQGAINRQAQMAGIRVNFEDLPTADVIGKHLSGMLCYTAVEGDCARMGCVSDIGAPVLAAPVVALATLVLIPKSRAEQQARAMQQAQRAAAEAEARAAEQAGREQEMGKLREENAMLRERLANLEAQLEELLRDTEEK